MMYHHLPSIAGETNTGWPIVNEPLRTPRPGGNVVEFSVSELSAAIKRTLEGCYGHVRLRGEISGYRGPHASGHCYFALKDDKAKIEAVIWRGVFASLRFKPQDGLEVVVIGKVSSFPGSSKYQIVIEVLEPAGIGALMALLEERKKKLAGEGLFAEGRKQKIPFLPRVVGIITSPTGAVIRDMLHGFSERFPTHVLLWPVRVQGDSCAGEVATAIHGFNALPPGGPIPRPDVLIVARGGGSLEDLLGFSEEIVVRAAAESRIPLISAVGHETDWTLVDFAASARAPTPTKAAEWAVPKYTELIDATAKLRLRLGIGTRRVLDGHRRELRAVTRGLPRLEDLIALPRQRFDAAERRLARALFANTQAHAKSLARLAPRLQPRLLSERIARAGEALDRHWQRATALLARSAGQRRTRLERTAGRLSPLMLAHSWRRARDRLNGLAQLLASLSYQSVLRRGFALVRDTQGRAVRQAVMIKKGSLLDIEFSDGHAAATALGAGTSARHDRGVPQSARRAIKGEDGGTQGSLF
jgi:exodeoxyribonuclease VII large subunit